MNFAPCHTRHSGGRRRHPRKRARLRPSGRSASKRPPEPRRRDDTALLRGVAPRRVVTEHGNFRRHRQRPAADCRRQRGYGQAVAVQATEMAIAKAQKDGFAVLGLRNSVTSDASVHTARCARRLGLPQLLRERDRPVLHCRALRRDRLAAFDQSDGLRHPRPTRIHPSSSTWQPAGSPWARRGRHDEGRGIGRWLCPGRRRQTVARSRRQRG